MTDAAAIRMLTAVREVGRIGARLGVRMRFGEAAELPPEDQARRAESQACIRALLAERPPLAWDGDRLEGALLLEVGERAARALRRVRRRARRHDGRGVAELQMGEKP
jgi:hypothetical protein